MNTGDATDQEVAELIEHNREAASALIRGDIRGYLTHISHADDYTLMPPTGGQPIAPASTALGGKPWTPWSDTSEAARPP